MDFEKLGVFYLGREVEPDTMQPTDQALLYDSGDLTTHAVVVGMTGSGKTGLGVGLIEEAAIDGIPVLAIDPKGDLTNLALTFPDLAPGDFEPWVNAREAERQGMSVTEYAAQQARQWREGLAAWGQDGARIERLRAAAEVAVYTPGSSAGRGISVLRSFAAPPQAVLDDADLVRDRLEATVTSLLTLMGLGVDPLSRESILLANILEHAWRAGEDLSVASLIAAVQQPPFKRFGVMDLETVFPAKDRLKLALGLNNLLAAPSFEAWMRGEALDVQSLLHEPSGKARVAVVSIAHLSDAERMFFVTLLLSEVVAWTRSQSGTSSLRALVYIDELYGFLPPVAEPPSKKPLLTLLKQARAFGVGLALTTQNPVDLDYKALSNAGTWLIGRLQTERDKQRLAEGLNAATAGTLRVQDLTEQIGRLPKRTFLLHNVHDKRPTIFQTRWALSYLAGPLTRDQIRRLDAAQPPQPQESAAASMESAAAVGPAGVGHAAVGPAAVDPAAPNPAVETDARPFLPPHVPQAFLPARVTTGARYFPMVLGVADVHYDSKTYGLSLDRRVARLTEIREGMVPVDFSEGDEADVDLATLSTEPQAGVTFTALPDTDTGAAAIKGWNENFARWLRVDGALTLLRNKELKLVAALGESEQSFRLRCSQALRERRDAAIDKVRKRYDSKLNTLSRRLLARQQAVERESQLAQTRGIDTAVSIGSAVLGAFMGRKGSSLTRVSSAVKKSARMTQGQSGVSRAKESLAQTEAEMAALNAEFEQELAALSSSTVLAEEIELGSVTISPTSRDVAVRFLGVAWVPFLQGADGRWSVRA